MYRITLECVRFIAALSYAGGMDSVSKHLLNMCYNR